MAKRHIFIPSRHAITSAVLCLRSLPRNASPSIYLLGSYRIERRSETPAEPWHITSSGGGFVSMHAKVEDAIAATLALDADLSIADLTVERETREPVAARTVESDWSLSSSTLRALADDIDHERAPKWVRTDWLRELASALERLPRSAPSTTTGEPKFGTLFELPCRDAAGIGERATVSADITRARPDRLELAISWNDDTRDRAVSVASLTRDDAIGVASAILNAFGASPVPVHNPA